MSRRNAEPVKIVFINTQYVETNATSFKSVVQRLTGKDSTVEVKPRPGGPVAERRTAKTSGGGSSVLSRGVSFKEFDRLLMDLPPLDEVYRMCAD